MFKGLKNKFYRYLLQNIVIFLICGSIYYFTEIIFKHSHTSDISMILCAGTISVIVGMLNDIFSYDMLLQLQLIIGTIVATVCEGITGIILVAIYGHNPVWDYGDLPLTFFNGQCNVFFCLLWIPLVFLAILMADCINYYMFDGERAYYRIGKNKIWFWLPEKKTQNT